MNERIAKLKNKMYRVGDLAYGSIQERMNVCTRPKCKCKRAQKHGPYFYLSFVGRDGRVRHIYIKKSELKVTKRRLGNFEQLKGDIIEVQEAMGKERSK